MSFAKLAWMLQTKQLWLSAIETLGDQWEVTFDTPQLNTIINRRPLTDSAAAATARAAPTISALRRRTFVNCWSAGEHESHALWKVFCPSSEGVAIQTTLARLRESLPLPVLEVEYGPHGSDGTSPDVRRLVAQKRPMFAYEREVRIVLEKNLDDAQHPERRTVGAGIPWDPGQHLERVWVHPEAPFWFIETVTETVQRLAPALSDQGHVLVCWSQMNLRPPF
jgi:hypothetical protein